MEKICTNINEDFIRINEVVTLIRDAEEWVLYQKDMEKFRSRTKHHFGTPKHFPCLVITIEEPEEPLRYFEHIFIYPEAAYLLIELNKKLNDRIVKVLNDVP
jgi:hypothetical protein